MSYARVVRTRVFFVFIILIFSGSVWAKDACFSIGTLNLWHYRDDYSVRATRIVDAASGFPQIMAFQEAAQWETGESLYEEFLKASGYQGFFSKTNQKKDYFEGLALASEFSFLESREVELPGSSRIARRRMIVGKYEIQGKTLWVLNVHFMPFPLMESVRKDQGLFVASYIRKHRLENAIVLGDFNTGPESKAFRNIGWSGLTAKVPLSGVSYSADNPYNRWGASKRLDHIVFNPKRLRLKSWDYFMNREPVSDHYGVRAEFCL